MTEQEIADLGPAFAGYLLRFGSCFPQKRVANHFDTFCRGLLSDLPRKTVEPIALDSGTAVRTLQEFLATDRVGPRPRPRPPPAAPGRRSRGPPGRRRSAPSASSTRRVARSGATRRPACSGSTWAASARSTTASSRSTSGWRKGPFQALLDADLYLPRVVGRGPRPVPGGRHPRRRRLPGQVADRPGPVAAAGRQRGVIRLADVRRGVRQQGAVLAGPGPGGPEVRGRGAGEFRGPPLGRRVCRRVPTNSNRRRHTGRLGSDFASRGKTSAEAGVAGDGARACGRPKAGTCW